MQNYPRGEIVNHIIQGDNSIVMCELKLFMSLRVNLEWIQSNLVFVDRHHLHPVLYLIEMHGNDDSFRVNNGCRHSSWSFARHPNLPSLDQLYRILHDELGSGPMPLLRMHWVPLLNRHHSCDVYQWYNKH